MATQMKDDAARLGMGGNNPPLADRMVLEFDEALRGYDFDLLARITEVEGKAAAAGPCLDDETAGRYGETVKSTVAMVRVIDAERETLNRPLLDAQRALISSANTYKDRLITAEKRIRGHLDEYADRQKKAREAAERERLRLIAVAEAEARRIADIERARLQAIEDEKAERERARLQAIEDERAARERDRLQAIEVERAAAEAREVKKVEVAVAVVEVAAAEVVVEAAPIAEIYSKPVYAPVRSDRGVLVAASETWDVEIENIRQVPDLFLKNPAVIEALRKVIAPSVRGKNGLRNLKGCRIFPTTKARVG